MRQVAFKHQTHRETILKFVFLLLILVGYFGYLSWKYDIVTGGLVAALTWSFFVLCTPVADAGFLLDFPIRLLFKVRMVVTEVGVWVLAFGINIATLAFKPEVYQQTLLTSAFHKILTTPYPYWGIVALCALGTFLSIYFGDEMMDVITHDQRTKHHSHGFTYKIIAVVALIVTILLMYKHLIEDMGIQQFL